MKPGGSGMSREEGAVELSDKSTAHLRPDPIIPLPFSIFLFFSLFLSGFLTWDYGTFSFDFDGSFYCWVNIVSGLVSILF